MWEILKDFLFPKVCVVCGLEECNLCKVCKRNLGLSSSQLCPTCGEESVMGWTHKTCLSKWGMDGLIHIYEYGDPGVRLVIDSIKYEFNRELISELLEGTSFELGEKFDFLVPVPLHFYRENWRGFNQATLIAEEVSRFAGIEVLNALKRNKNTKQQVLMKSRAEREQNVKGVFGLSVVSSKRDLKGKKVLLVDDVFTSGADMKECCKCLKKAGVEKVWGLALAH